MYPIKRKLTLQEAMEYTGVKRSTFLRHIASKISVYGIGSIRLYNVSDIDKLLEENILIDRG